jgi:GT2 family glycosyltransferase
LDGKLYDPPLDELRFDTLMGALIRHNVFYVSTILFHRSVLERVGLLDEGFRYCEDWDWALRMAPHLKMVYMPEVLVTRRDQPTSFSKTYSGRYQYYVRLYHKHVDSIEPTMRGDFKKNMGNKCYSDAVKLLKSGRRSQANAAYREALKLRPMLIFRIHKLASHCIGSCR